MTHLTTRTLDQRAAESPAGYRHREAHRIGETVRLAGRPAVWGHYYDEAPISRKTQQRRRRLLPVLVYPDGSELPVNLQAPAARLRRLVGAEAVRTGEYTAVVEKYHPEHWVDDYARTKTGIVRTNRRGRPIRDGRRVCPGGCGEKRLRIISAEQT